MSKIKAIGVIAAAKKVGVEMHRLYAWEKYGIVRPQRQKFGTRWFRKYSQRDIERAIFIRFLVDDEGYALQSAVKKLNEKER